MLTSLIPQTLRSKQGQIALFVVLIFEVLFVFFAMVISISLTVFDKINLQNSTDLAVLYGAQKQAEVLNVMAHINYQMRQNYKLLAWRYRVLGTLPYPYNNSPRSSSDAWCPAYTQPPPANSPSCQVTRDCPSYGSNGGYCDENHYICVSHPLWTNQPPLPNAPISVGGLQTDYCKNTYTPVEIPAPVPSVPVFDLSGYATETQNLRQELIQNVATSNAFNWLFTQLILTHFRLDGRDRKLMMEGLFNKSLKANRDLNGDSIRDGVLNTFKNNLNFSNKKNFDEEDEGSFQYFNSFFNKNFDSFLQAISLCPILKYFDNSPGSNKISLHYQNFNTHSSGSYGLPSLVPTASSRNFLKSLFELNGNSRGELNCSTEKNPFTLTLGFKKARGAEDTLYSALFVEISHNQTLPLFYPSLNENLVFKASAFAKAFGGRIGPKEVDPLISPHLTEKMEGRRLKVEAQLQPNHSRFPGDSLGLIHRSVHESHYLVKATGSYRFLKRPYDINYYKHLFRGDSLAFDSSGDPLFLRMMELMAVAPDLYDVRHYSFFSNYMDYYFPKLCKLLTGSDCNNIQEAPSFTSSQGEAHVRGDFGYPQSESFAIKNRRESRKYQESSLTPFYFTQGEKNIFRGLKSTRPSTNALNNGNYFYNTIPPWIIKNPSHFLNSWTPPTLPKRYEDYDVNLSDTNFLKCQKYASHEKPIPSGCTQGGRAGFSVKLISCEMAKSLQPPVAFLDKSCPSD